jgi:hypothetical protein
MAGQLLNRLRRGSTHREMRAEGVPQPVDVAVTGRPPARSARSIVVVRTSAPPAKSPTTGMKLAALAFAIECRTSSLTAVARRSWASSGWPQVAQ